MSASKKTGLLAVIGPGVLVAATGVGVGDLAGAGLAGSKLGLAVAWAVVVGALMKFVLNEALARWQLATGETVLDGAFRTLGPVVWAVFGFYLLLWTLFVGAALVAGAGVTLQLLVAKLGVGVGWPVLGPAASATALTLVYIGGFKLFERVMAVCIAVMFAVVVGAAGARLAGEPGLLADLAGGIALPLVPPGGLGWTLALLGGVGGTLTVVCYSYWMREAGREGPAALRACRIDLGVGYTMTGVFGLSMLVIASGVKTDGRGLGLVLGLAGSVGDSLGGWTETVFIVGAFGAIFSSMLGVWQGVPYVFADWAGAFPGSRRKRGRVSTRSWLYRGYALWIAGASCGFVFLDFDDVQLWYGVFGAFFVPLLAAALIALCNRSEMGDLRNRALANGALGISAVGLIAITLYQQWPKIAGALGG